MRGINKPETHCGCSGVEVMAAGPYCPGHLTSGLLQHILHGAAFENLLQSAISAKY